MDSEQTYCVGGRHKSNTIAIIEYEKTLKRKKSLKLEKENVITVVEVNHKFLLSK